jgi:predicted RNase H-like nuclease (RuvC/YqgF family)
LDNSNLPRAHLGGHNELPTPEPSSQAPTGSSVQEAQIAELRKSLEKVEKRCTKYKAAIEELSLKYQASVEENMSLKDELKTIALKIERGELIPAQNGADLMDTAAEGLAEGK